MRFLVAGVGLPRRLARAVQYGGLMPRRRVSQKPHGFTLVELMITVAIVGILASLAIYGVRKYVLVSKTAEPIEIINSVRAAEEAYKDETFRYLSTTTNLGTYHPAAPDTNKRSWVTGNATKDDPWKELGVNVSAPVQFGYACVAGPAGEGIADLGVPALNYPTSPASAWYVVKAVGNRDGDSELAILVGSSFTDEIYSEHEDE